MQVYMGQRLRITLLVDVTGIIPQKVVAAAGTVYEGVVSDADDMFFDLNLDNGEVIGFCSENTTIRIEVMDE